MGFLVWCIRFILECSFSEPLQLFVCQLTIFFHVDYPYLPSFLRQSFHYVDQVGTGLAAISQPLASGCWYYRHVLPCLAARPPLLPNFQESFWQLVMKCLVGYVNPESWDRASKWQRFLYVALPSNLLDPSATHRHAHQAPARTWQLTFLFSW